MWDVVVRDEVAGRRGGRCKVGGGCCEVWIGLERWIVLYVLVLLRLRRWGWGGGGGFVEGKRGGLDVVGVAEFVIVNAMCDGSRMYGSFFVAMYVQMIF